MSNYEIRKQIFKNTYEQNKNHFFINHPNKFGIYSNKGFIENQIYTPNTIAEELKKLEFFPGKFFFKESSNLVYSKNTSMKNLVSIEMQFPGGNVSK